MRRLLLGLLLACASATAVSVQSPGTCSPPNTATCDPNGVPIPGGGGGTGGESSVTVVNAVTASVRLGGGLAVKGAEGIALDPSSGLVYIGLNGAIISGCPGDATRGAGVTPGPGSGQISVVDPAAAREVAAVRTGQAPIWPTVDPNRRVVYMMGSGGTGTVTVHNASDGRVIKTITVGGRPHMAGLDYSTGLMLVGNTVRSSDVVAEQNHATIINTATDAVTRNFETSPAPHGVVVDQDRDLMYFSAVGDGAIVVVSAATGQVLTSGVPKRAYGDGFGGNNMLGRQASARRLFQVNTQAGATGLLVVDEVTLAAEKVISFGDYIPWGMTVDEPNRLLFVALPQADAIGVVDLDTLSYVARVPVGPCPYAVAVDPQRRLAVTSNQGTPAEDATASILNLCPVYVATNRLVAGCSAADRFRLRRRP